MRITVMSFSSQPLAGYRARSWLLVFAPALFLPFMAHAQEPCRQGTAVLPLLYAGGKATARPATLHYSAALARSGLVVAGPGFDGPAGLRAMADPWAAAPVTPGGGEPPPAMASQRRGEEDGQLRIDRDARFIHVALPERREGGQVLYAVSRFALVPGAAVYRLVLAAPSQNSACGASRPSDGRATPALAEAAADKLPWKGVSLRRVALAGQGSFSMPQTSVPLTVGRRQPDLYQAATDALHSPGFSQSSLQASASRPGELVLGSAAGRHSAADFDVQMRLSGKGVLDIAVLSNLSPMEINEESARARELSDRVLHAFPMLSPVQPVTRSPATMQEKKP